MEPRGVALDIETSPLICYTWDKYPNNGVIEVIEDYQILSIAWQWVGEKKVHVVGQDDFPGYIPGINDDKEIMHRIWEILDEADFIIAHNGDAFDVKKINTRLMVHGLNPPSPYRQVDTKKIAKRVGGFTSNSLKDLSRDLEVNRKGDAGGFATWKGCLAGDKKAWKHMKKYNKQDIPPLMDLYLRFRPWDKQRLPMNTMMERPEVCPACGGSEMRAGMIYHSTKSGKYQYFHCKSCGASSKARVPSKTIKPLYV